MPCPLSKAESTSASQLLPPPVPPSRLCKAAPCSLSTVQQTPQGLPQGHLTCGLCSCHCLLLACFSSDLLLSSTYFLFCFHSFLCSLGGRSEEHCPASLSTILPERKGTVPENPHALLLLSPVSLCHCPSLRVAVFTCPGCTHSHVWSR